MGMNGHEDAKAHHQGQYRGAAQADHGQRHTRTTGSIPANHAYIHENINKKVRMMSAASRRAESIPGHGRDIVWPPRPIIAM